MNTLPGKITKACAGRGVHTKGPSRRLQLQSIGVALRIVMRSSAASYSDTKRLSMLILCSADLRMEGKHRQNALNVPRD